jgi:hypothetical protein
MNVQLYVALDVTDVPPVIVIPKHPEVDPGKHRLTWSPIGGTTFTFDSFDPKAYPFSNVIVNENGDITANYENRESKHEFPYVITVISEGKQYRSAVVNADGSIRTGGSTIKNK